MAFPLSSPSTPPLLLTAPAVDPVTGAFAQAINSMQLFQSERDTPVIDSFPTPESSPLYPRRPKSSHNTHEAPLCIWKVMYSHIPQYHPFSSQDTSQPEAEITPLAILTHASSAPARSLPTPPFHIIVAIRRPPDSSPMLVDDMFSPGSSAASTSKSTPLKAPLPRRPAGSEMSRIRLQFAAEKAAHRDRSEVRRPDYLKRTKRPSADLEDGYDTDDVLVLNGKSTANTGVLESPVKGRRIGQFQKTSEESFEESLLASGYTPYGDRPAYTEAQTPPTAAIGKARATLSQPAMGWLQHETPASAQKSSQRRNNKPSREGIPSEKEVKKPPRHV
ncbi:hypothetical protein BXZ70DRAFT_1063122 [Cristinia sonorae]|uniref:Uncharacterized protein n=1 Tax=Cristinia sonorae TaxID=1940300 RepID=A0A8K0UUR7_9AGAR|nr:hypothetical protein BXZ70DRAFT_1063122 [Cristinia sonorae]